MIKVIRAERNTRRERLREEDCLEYAYDQWLFTEQPFVNELCLMLLVTICHQVERELIWIAARAMNNGREIDGKDYRQRVRDERQQLRRHDGWASLIDRLGLDTFAEWDASMETLRLLANSYKHHPSATPDEELLNHLGLDLRLHYAPLSESWEFQKGLAESLGLQEDADYTDIADELLACTSRFLAKVEAQPGLSKVRWEPVDFTDFAH